MGGWPMTSVERAGLLRWRDRWRYPMLVSRLVAGESIDWTTVSTDVLSGLAEPQADLPASIQMLVAAGEYLAAQSLLDDDQLIEALPANTLVALRDEITARRGTALHELDRRSEQLRSRARRVDIEDTMPDATSELRRHADAMAALDAWESDIVRGEQVVEADLRSRLSELGRPAPDPWTDSIVSLIEAREYPAAWHRLEAGPTEDPVSGPWTVPRLTEWPWIVPCRRSSSGTSIPTGRPRPASAHSGSRRSPT